MNKIYLGDCLETMRGLPDNSVDAIVTDPPYGLSFMGKKWDYDVPSVDIWQECLRVLKPGGYLLAFAGTRTQHRMACRIEDAGFEIRDMIAWVYGSGFPKSLNIGKAVDKLQGNERETLGKNPSARVNKPDNDIFEAGIRGKDCDLTKGTSAWEGFGTALKPALEPITMARKPLGEKTVAENCLKWGVGGIDIDGSRVEHNEECRLMAPSQANISNPSEKCMQAGRRETTLELKPGGRWPANLIHDGSEEVVSLFPNDNQRFFYCAKASKSERNRGCEELEEKQYSHDGREKEIENAFQRNKSVANNNHPTVKPIALMEYLVKLVSREGATVLDPFAGSGSTLIACKKLGRNYIGCEMDAEYVKIAEARLSVIKNN